MHAHQFAEEAAIADAREAVFFLFGIQRGQIVFFIAAEAGDVFARGLGNRSFGHEVLPGLGRGNREVVGLTRERWTGIVDEPVAAKHFLVEKDFRDSSASAIDLAVQIFGKAGDVDSEFFNHAFGDCAVGLLTFDGVGAAIADEGSVVYAEFVAAGVSTEVVVIIEDENARLRAGGFAIEVSGGESADASADDDQIVGLAGVLGLPCRIPESAVAQSMC